MMQFFVIVRNSSKLVSYRIAAPKQIRKNIGRGLCQSPVSTLRPLFMDGIELSQDDSYEEIVTSHYEEKVYF